MIGGPLDGQVVAILQDFNLGEIALIGEDCKNIARHQAIGRIIVPIDGRGGIRELLQNISGNGVEVGYTNIRDTGVPLRDHLPQHVGFLVPPEIGAGPALDASVQIERPCPLQHGYSRGNNNGRLKQIQRRKFSAKFHEDQLVVGAAQVRADSTAQSAGELG